MTGLIRFGVSMDRELLESFDREIVLKGYANRSEAIRDLIRNELVGTEWSDDDAEVAGTITLVYDHHVRGLNDLLLELQHRYVDLIVSTMHVHLAHDRCLEVLLIKGQAGEAKDIANQLLSIKGVIHGRLTATSTGEKLK
ncbi:MAG: nickel-responsive transcriptional regulator NikR [Firmicutes bacterium]|nr:nickel-responsive transcriptional regulator NikR [Bacillota bacterium]